MNARDEFTTHEDYNYPLATIARLVVFDGKRAYAALGIIRHRQQDLTVTEWRIACDNEEARLTEEINNDHERFLIAPGVTPQWV